MKKPFASALAATALLASVTPDADAGGIGRRVLLAPECATDLSRLHPQYPALRPGRFYLMVREHGDPGTPEWLGQVANPVTWDVGSYSGLRPPAPVGDWQRGYYDSGGAIGTSAVQWHCSDVGFLMNTYAFTRTVPVVGGGPHIAYEHKFLPRPRVWTGDEAGLRIRLELRLPWVYTVGADHAGGRGVAQTSLFLYAEHRRSGRIFAHVIGLFDSRPFGVGNGFEFIAHDTEFDYASSPLLAQTRSGAAPRYLRIADGSAGYVTGAGWPELRRFEIEIDRAHVQALLDDMRDQAGTPADRAEDFGIHGVGVLVEAAIGYADGYDVSLGGSFRDLTLETVGRESIFDDGLEPGRYELLPAD